jgi:hypothetical protein
MSKRAYRATRVNDVNWDQLAQGKDGLDITLGVDVGKYSLWAVCRWADGRFERPWRVENPGEIPTLLTLLKRVSAGRKLVVAMESSGTYGDALRQALADNQLEVRRVGGKPAHDYAEVFDGVPSQEIRRKSGVEEIRCQFIFSGKGVAEQGNGASYEQDNGATGAGQPCPGRRAHTTTLLGTQ